MKFLLALVAAIAGANAANVRSVECWLNDKCDTTQDHCLKQEYDTGSCYPKAGDNFSTKYSCVGTKQVKVEVYEGYGCKTTPKVETFPTHTCVVDPRGLNTIYNCDSGLAYLRGD